MRLQYAPYGPAQVARISRSSGRVAEVGPLAAASGVSERLVQEGRMAAGLALELDFSETPFLATGLPLVIRNPIFQRVTGSFLSFLEF